MTRKEYIDSIATIAVNSCSGTGLFPSTMIAQAIIESNNGNSDLAKEANNHFGIKADRSWKGTVWSGKTREVISGKDVYIVDGFRWYPTLLEGFKDRNNFLKANPRYAKAGVFDTLTPQSQAYYFEEAGYATDPNYAETICKVIQNEGLELYDKGFEKVRPLYVDASGLNLRTTPNGKVKKVLPLDSKLALVKGSDDWSLVWSYDIKDFGYVSSDYLKTVYI